MADYPAIDQSTETIRNVDGGVIIDRAVNGRVRARRMYDSTVYQFEVVHYVNGTDLTTLQNHFDTERGNIFGFTYQGDGSYYSQMLYADSPKIDWIAPNLWKVVNKLEGQA